MLGLIPQQFIDELLLSIDIVELIDSYLSLKKVGGSFVACCPFHNEKTPSFNVIAKKQFYYCFGCGAKGNAISFIMQYLNKNFPDAIDTLAARSGLQVPRENSSKKESKSINLYHLLSQVSKFYQENLKNNKQALAYLGQRGLSEDVIKLYQIGYASSSWGNLDSFKRYRNELITTGMLIRKENELTYARYRHRIIFPIHDQHGRIIAFGGRALDPSQTPKYLNSPETIIFQKSRELYGLYQIIKQRSAVNCILVVEGYMDVIALAQYGLNYVVATLGTVTSTFHIQLLSKFTQHIVFCFDGDSAGRRAAWRALECCLSFMHTDLHVGFVFLPESYDPDKLIREEGQAKFRDRLAQTKPLHDFFIETISKNLDLFSLMGRSKLINAAKPYLAKMLSSPYKELLLNRLSRLSHIETQRLNLLIQDKIAYNKIYKPLKRSPLQLAIALLLQNPEIYYQSKQHINLDLLDSKAHRILLKILLQIDKNPEINTASLIEPWRHTSFFEALSKLASWDHKVSEQAIVKEFTDIILFLQKQNLENKIKLYIAKSRNQGLTVTERLNLQEMLKQRHLNNRLLTKVEVKEE